MESKLLTLKKKLVGKKDSKSPMKKEGNSTTELTSESFYVRSEMDLRPSFEHYEAEIRKRSTKIDDEAEESNTKSDYWSEEGSKLFQKWTPAASKNETEEKQGFGDKFFSKALAWKKSPKSSLETVTVEIDHENTPMLFDPNYKFLHPDTTENLIFSDVETKDGIPMIKGGTLAKLVERLTYDKYVDTNYLQQFLLTYRTFTTPEEFLSLLVERYNVSDPVSATPNQLKKFSTLKKVVRLRVFNVLKTWVDKHYYDFNSALIMDLLKFCETLNSTGMEKSATFLKEFVSRKRTGSDEVEKKLESANSSTNIAQGISSTVELSKLNALEVARQMTLIEFEKYRAILPSEFNNQAWAKGPRDEKEKNSPNVIAMIERFNQVSNWVATTIVFEDDLISRRDLLVYFIHLANSLRELHNFNGMMEVIAGVTSTSAYRLKKTWNLVDRNTMTIFEELNTLLSRDNNFANFRKALHQVQPPALPYLGVYLTDMIFVDQGNPDFISGTNLINFHKRRLLSFVIREIQQYQQLPYTFKKVEFIEEYLLNLKYKTEDECYSQSLKIEPREDTSKQVERKALPPGYDPPDVYDFDYPLDYPFKEADSEDNITFLPFDESRQKFFIKSGTIEKLIERLTYPKHPDPEYLSAFLMTYRSFCAPKQLFDLLIHRFNTPLPKNCLEEELNSFLESRRTPIRLRVSNVFKHWIDKYFTDFMEDRSLITSFLQFIKSYNDSEQAIEKAFEQLKKLMQRKLKEQLEESEEEISIHDYISILTQSQGNDNFDFFSLQPAEFAQQISLLHKRTYLSIDIVKMLKSNYEFAREFGPGGNLSMLVTFQFRDADGSGNVLILDLFSKETVLLYNHFEKIQNWVHRCLITARNLVERIDIVTRFIEMAETSRQINSFHAMAAIVYGLTSPTAKSFKKLWAIYPSRPHLALLHDMQQLIDRKDEDNMLYLKLLKQTSGSPSVPFFLPYLQKLTKLSIESNEINGQINFDKRKKISDTLNEILVFQKKSYEWTENLDAQKFLVSLPLKASQGDEDLIAMASTANEMDESSKEDISSISTARFGRKTSGPVLMELSRTTSKTMEDRAEETALKESIQKIVKESLEKAEKESEKESENVPEKDSEKETEEKKEKENGKDNQSQKETERKEATEDEIIKEIQKQKERMLFIANNWSQMNNQEKNASQKEVIRICFPELMIEEWEEDDQDGEVYGKSCTVSLKIHRLSDKTVLVTFIPSTRLEDLDMVVKEREFHNKREPDNVIDQTVLITLHHEVTDLAQFKNLAQQNQIILYHP